MSITHQIGIRRVQAITAMTVAHPDDGTALHLIDVEFPEGTVLDHLALSQPQLVELNRKLSKLERAGFDSEFTREL